MADNFIRVEVVVPVHNRKDTTLRCLRSISRLERNRTIVHVTVVDDGSSDGTAEAIEREFPEVTVIRADGTLWFTEGTNVGVRSAMEREPDYLLLINDDQVFDDRSLRFMLESASAFSRSIVGPLLLRWDTPHVLFQTAPVWSTFGGGWRHWFKQTVWTIPDGVFEVKLIVGNCVLIPAQAIRECGLMNSGRYPNFGDAEYTPRMRRNGWKLLIEPRARVFCQPNTSPPRIRSLDLKRQFEYLLLDLKHTHNLRRRFYAYWDGAPSRTKGTLAFGLFLGRLLIGKNIENEKRSANHIEPLLKDLFIPEPKGQ